MRTRSEACAIREHLFGVPQKNKNSLVEDGSGSVGEFIGELQGDDETKNICAGEVECSDDGPVVQLPFFALPVCCDL